MKSSISLLLTFAVFLPTKSAFGQYRLVGEYSGEEFFSKWDFVEGIDPDTDGNVQYVDQNTALQQRLAYIDSETGNAILRVDNTTRIETGSSAYRDSVKMFSKDAYPVGGLIIMDAVHIPYGCSVWPVFGARGADLPWPEKGAIDIIEGVNGMTSNNMVMYTDAGCTQASNVVQTGKTVDRDCGTALGCKVEETKPNSYGPGFSRAGGGVFAAQIDTSGIFLWFWSRTDIPASISNVKSDTDMDMSDWGQPSAAYPAATCDIAKFFKPRKLVLHITLCGSWAGVLPIYSQTCPGECIANVIGDGSNYGEAYWEISYIRTFAVQASNSRAVSISIPMFDLPISTRISTNSISIPIPTTSSGMTSSVLSPLGINSDLPVLPSSCDAATISTSSITSLVPGTLTVSSDSPVFPTKSNTVATGSGTVEPSSPVDSNPSSSSSSARKLSPTATLFSVAIPFLSIIILVFWQ
uniref:GH16 domain-containing protein n=1 Tax=Moniliophthora roreri TaxID=221103 RepID=A0A0W0FCX0_MONRR